MSDGVIDLRDYLKDRHEERKGAFSIWGGEGERSRLALPMWRATYLAGGDWGALVWGREDHVPRTLKPFFVLDLATEPARTEASSELVAGLWNVDAPTFDEHPPGSVGVCLGVESGRRWFLVISGRPLDSPVEPGVRDDLLFLAGECAGLLFHRDLARDGGPGHG